VWDALHIPPDSAAAEKGPTAMALVGNDLGLVSLMDGKVVQTSLVVSLLGSSGCHSYCSENIPQSIIPSQKRSFLLSHPSYY
jgi:hypothetical protein